MPRTNSRPDTPDARTLAGLKAFQRTLAAAIMAPLTPQDGMKRGTKEARKALPLVKPNDRLTAFERLEIYNVQYWLRVRDALREDFPALAVALGEKKFEALARAYLATHPSRSFTLRNLGSRLPEFLAKPSGRKWTAPRAALALDLARFEWAQIAAFDEAQLPPVGADILGGGHPGNLRFRLQPHLTLLALDHPVDAFVLGLRHEARLRSEASNVLVAKKKKKTKTGLTLPKPEKTWIAVHRSDQLLYTKRLGAEEYRVLTALGEGKTLAQACDAAFPKALPKRNPEAEMDRRSRLLGSSFRLWGELGWLAKR